MKSGIPPKHAFYIFIILLTFLDVTLTFQARYVREIRIFQYDYFCALFILLPLLFSLPVTKAKKEVLGKKISLFFFLLLNVNEEQIMKRQDKSMEAEKKMRKNPILYYGIIFLLIGTIIAFNLLALGN